MKKVLLICTSFPPVNATAVHRTLALARQLCNQGRQVMVLTMSPPPELKVDQKLMAKVPEGLKVVTLPQFDLVGRLKQIFLIKSRSVVKTVPAVGVANAKPSRRGMIDWCTSWLQFPDNRVGWFLGGLLKAWRAARSFQPDVVYSTAPMWSAHLLGMAMRLLLKKPWVADCRDPWRANPYRAMPHRAHDRADAALERRMVIKATAVICNTPAVHRDFCQRYRDQRAKFRTITNGFDQADISAVLGEATLPAPDALRLVHTGMFYGPRTPVPLFEALAILVKEQPELRESLRFVHVGSESYDGVPMAKLAAEHGVQDLLELTGPLGHRQALLQVAAGSVALAASQDGQNGDFQVPRKFYEYYGLRKPILAWGGACRAIREIFGRGPVPGLWLVDGAKPAELAQALTQIVQVWRQGQLKGPDNVNVDLSEDRMARRIEEVLLSACAPPQEAL